MEVKENFFKSGRVIIIRSVIILSILLVIIAIAAIRMYEEIIGDFNPDVLGTCTPVILVSLFISSYNIRALYRGIKGQNSFNKLIKEIGMDGILQEVQNDSLYIYGNKNKPITVITKKHIFDKYYGVYDSTNVDYMYSRDYKGDTSIRFFDINNKCVDIARGIIVGSPMEAPEFLKIMEAIQKNNPGILVGYLEENRQEHLKRVKAHKGK